MTIIEEFHVIWSVIISTPDNIFITHISLIIITTNYNQHFSTSQLQTNLISDESVKSVKLLKAIACMIGNIVYAVLVTHEGYLKVWCPLLCDILLIVVTASSILSTWHVVNHWSIFWHKIWNFSKNYIQICGKLTKIFLKGITL